MIYALRQSDTVQEATGINLYTCGTQTTITQSWKRVWDEFRTLSSWREAHGSSMFSHTGKCIHADAGFPRRSVLAYYTHTHTHRLSFSRGRGIHRILPALTPSWSPVNPLIWATRGTLSALFSADPLTRLSLDFWAPRHCGENVDLKALLFLSPEMAACLALSWRWIQRDWGWHRKAEGFV